MRPRPRHRSARLPVVLALAAVLAAAAAAQEADLQAAARDSSAGADSLAAPTAPTPVPRPDLSGVWQLDEGQSDDLASKLQEAMQKMREQMGATGGGMGGMGRGGTGGMGGGRPGSRPDVSRGRGGTRGGYGGGEPALDESFGGREPPQEEAGLLGLARGLETLLVVQEENAIELMDGRDRTVRLPTDGTPVTRQFGGSLHRQSATWQAGRLRVESVLEDGPSIVRIYSLDPAERRIRVDGEIRLPRADETITFRLIYTGL